MRNPMRSTVVAVAMWAGACGGQAAIVDSDDFAGADETVSSSDALTGSHAVGTTLQATGNVNLRRGPGTSYGVIRTVPRNDRVKLVDASPKSGWYHISYNGSKGWSYGVYLKLAPGVSAQSADSASDTGSGSTTNSALANVLARARSGVGFSYWWGHARWTSGGPTSSNSGYCTGTCPSCTHSGQNGADCSGLLAKAWSLGSTALEYDQHPYSTYNFRYESTHWHQVPTANVREGDAFVYNSNGAGHTFIYAGGDKWGSMWAYEAKGCAVGIVHDLRTAGSAYVGIARNGY